MPRRAAHLLLISLALLLGACQSLYFHDAAQPAPSRRLDVAQLPSEYWTGIVFNGEKIGFTQLALAREGEGWRIDSRAALRFQLLGYHKSITLDATDHLGPDLQLRSFRYRYDLDGSVLESNGERVPQGLQLQVIHGGESSERIEPVPGELWPASVIQLMPVLRGLDTGARYRYTVYDGESDAIAEVEQEVIGLQGSDLFEGSAWRVRTRMQGQEVTTWINDEGLPQLELSLNGVLVSYLESAERAREYLLEAALSKREALLNFSVVHLEPPLREPRTSTRLVLDLEELPEGFEPAAGSGQRCEQLEPGRLRCVIDVREVDPHDAIEPRHLAASSVVPSGSTAIRTLATRILAEAPGTAPADAMLAWVHANIEPVAVDSFSALDVLAARRGECQGQSALLAALLRASGIAARVVNGLVWSEDLGAFAWHAWVEAWNGTRWEALDAVFGQRHADATHLRLVEGETRTELVPLLALIGRVRVSAGSEAAN